MKKYQLNIKRHVRTSAMPAYILMLSVLIMDAFGNRNYVADDIIHTLGKINSLIDGYSFKRRNKSQSGTIIHRKINENSIELYSTTGETLLMTIYFYEI